MSDEPTTPEEAGPADARQDAERTTAERTTAVPTALPPGQPQWPTTPPAPVSVAPPPIFGARWPAPAHPPSRAVLVGAVAAGLTAAVAVPAGRPGIGWFVTALVLAAAAVAVGWRRPRSRRAAATDLGWLLVAVALAGVSAVRDAGWFVTLCLVAACGAGSLAVAGRSFRNVLMAGAAMPVAALRGVPWVARGLRHGDTQKGLRIAVAAVVGVLLLTVFGSLLAEADAAFATVLDALVPTLDGPSTARSVGLFVLGAASAVGGALLLMAPPAPPDAGKPPSRLRGLEWALPVGLLAGLFALFVAVQLATLFGSDDHVVRTTGLTYAEYARSGFWQLLAVTALALCVIVAASRWAPENSPAARTTKRVLLGTLAVLTLVIVASALSRMWLYQQAYGFTVLRLLVLTCELWLGVGFVIVLWSVLRLRAGGPTRGMVVAGAVALLALAVLDPERFVAERNVDRYTTTGEFDAGYHARLSADAVPALGRLPEPVRSCALNSIAHRIVWEDDDWRSANAARAGAAATLAGAQTGC
ncbi:DUF4173 domain-containing protein [Pseudonocardia aurantiaca]|uniref:DUF4153 domain-containing protein n=1 Tax=Pseudonocardia aurantiaca TaxID=75290 RepID=UPI0031CEDDAB